MLFIRRNIGTEATSEFWNEDIVAFAVHEYSESAAAMSEESDEREAPWKEGMLAAADVE